MPMPCSNVILPLLIFLLHLHSYKGTQTHRIPIQGIDNRITRSLVRPTTAERLFKRNQNIQVHGFTE